MRTLFSILAVLMMGAPVARTAEQLNLVAQPLRAAAAEWPVPEFAGRDFWIMLAPPLRGYDGVKDEEFIRESGVAVIRIDSYGGLLQRHGLHRQIAAQALEFRAAGGANAAAGAAVQPLPAESDADVAFFHPAALTAGDPEAWFVARGDQFNDDLRNQPMRAALEVRLAQAQPVNRIACRTGIRGAAVIAKLEAWARVGNQWQAAPGSLQFDKDQLTLALAAPISAAEWRVKLTSHLRQLVLRPESLPERDLMDKYPFAFRCRPWRAGAGNLLGLQPEQFDAESFSAFLGKYDKTFLGFPLPEWDSNLRGMRGRGMLDKYLPAYTNRADAYEKVMAYFKYQQSLFHDSVYAMSGNITWPQYAAEWGAKTLAMSVSGMHPNLPTRACILFTRSAGRQYGRPWQLYVTSFASYAHPRPSRTGEGKSATQIRREYFSAYYQGATFIEPEASENTVVAQDEGEKGYRLSHHGATLKELHEWSRKPEGARGTSYAPILFLVDLRHGHGGRRGWAGNLDWKIWDYLEMEDGDYMIEHAVRTVDRFVDSAGAFKGVAFYEPFAWNIRNSRLGDCCDIFFANPPSQGGVIKQEHLDKYAVAMPLGDIHWTPELAARVKQYVRAGGTLVINSAQCRGEMADPAFLGVTVGTNAVPADNLEILPLTLQGAETVMAGKPDLPLATRHRVGQGHVVVTAPRYLLARDRKTPAPIVEELLVKIQEEVLPVKIQGNCQFMLNRTADGRWMAVLINNEGVIKHPKDQAEFFLGAYAAPVTLTAPAGARAREVLRGAPLEQLGQKNGRVQVRVTVPAGEIRVVEFADVQL